MVVEIKRPFWERITLWHDNIHFKRKDGEHPGRGGRNPAGFHPV